MEKKKSETGKKLDEADDQVETHKRKSKKNV